MKERQEWRHAVVTRAQTISQGVRLIEFAVEGDLPAFEPGSHTTVEVVIDGGRAKRSYTCIPCDSGRIRVAVKHHDNSRGGSRFMWSLIEGAKLRVTVPDNRFELSWRASEYLLVAGGIGITPIFGMAKALTFHGAKVRLVYGARSRAEMAFAGELESLMGNSAEFFASDEGKRIDLAREIRTLTADGEMYICGPIAMLNAARELWATAKRPPSRLRYEVFGDSGEFPEIPFTVTVANSDVLVEVGTNQTLLEALTQAGIDMIWDCERGECGLCAVDILECDSEIDHRDVFFSELEKKENKRMCACVSRLAGGTALIDTGIRAT